METETEVDAFSGIEARGALETETDGAVETEVEEVVEEDGSSKARASGSGGVSPPFLDSSTRHLLTIESLSE